MALAFSSTASLFSSLQGRSVSSSSTRISQRGTETPNGGRGYFPSDRSAKRSLVTKAYPGYGKLDLYDRAPRLQATFLKNRIVHLDCPLGPEMMEILISQFIHLIRDDSQKPIYLYIDSTGVDEKDERLGYETEGLSIYDFISSTLVPAPIHTLCTGNAFNEFALLLASGEKGKRAALPSANIMIKEPSCFFLANATEAVSAREEMRILKKNMIEILAEITGQTEETIEEDIKRPKYFTPEEAVEYGLIDKVLYDLKGVDINDNTSLLR